MPQLLPELIENPITNDVPLDLLAMGDIDYNTAPDLMNTGTQLPRSTVGSLKLAHRGGNTLNKSILGESNWPQLSGTGSEIDFIVSLFAKQQSSKNRSMRQLRTSQASETAFRELAPHSRFIHVATHGFFADPSKKSALSSEMAKTVEQMNISGDLNQQVLRGFNPGQLSGLVFAGANLNRNSIDANSASNSAENDDGILTADEIAFLSLRNCELAVLSACETNVGEVAGGEGILGLQRSFQIAGARSVVSSLWKVDDLGTRLLMERFYTNMLVQRMSKLDALREAQIWMLRNPKELESLGMSDVRLERGTVGPISEKSLKAAQDRQKTKDGNLEKSGLTSPRFWAAFQLSGDWR